MGRAGRFNSSGRLHPGRQTWMGKGRLHWGQPGEERRSAFTNRAGVQRKRKRSTQTLGKHPPGAGEGRPVPQVGAGGCGRGIGSGSGSSSRRRSRFPGGTDSAARAGSSPLPLEKCCCHLMSSCSSVTLCGVGGAGGHPPLPPPLPEWEQPAEPAVSPQTQLSKPPACVPQGLGGLWQVASRTACVGTPWKTHLDTPFN